MSDFTEEIKQRLKEQRLLESATRDTERLNWLEKTRAKIEPPFRDDSTWVGIFLLNGWDCGGNSVREAIDTAMSASNPKE